MWYLWLQILFLLVLAALCGAGLAYWWLRGRFEDVTDTYSRLVSGSNNNAPDLMERSDLEARLSDLANKIDRLENIDLSPLESQLLSLSNEIPNAQPELTPLFNEIQTMGEEVRRSESFTQSIDERLAAIEASTQASSEAQAGIDALTGRLDLLENRLSDTLNTSFGQLQNAVSDTSDLDLTLVESQISALQEKVDKLASLAPQLATLSQNANELAETQTLDLKSELARIEQRFDTLSEGVVNPIRSELQAISAISPKTDSLTQKLEARLQAIEESLATNKTSLRPINEKLDEILPAAASSSANQRTLSALDQKLNGFETSIVAIKQRMDQIGALLTTLDQRVDPSSLQVRLDQTANDLAAIRANLTDKTALEPIDQALTRLQQMVFNLRERDISGLNNAIRTIESRVDFVGVENRLTSIEYGLAATHHMLRSRLEQASDLPPPPQREPYRDPPRDFAFAPQSSLQTPEAALDPVDMIRTPDRAGNLLLEPGFGQADNLEQIRGIGPMLRQLLNDTGIFYYWQIAEWTAEDVASVDALLPGYQGRITRDRWVEQAQELMTLSGSAKRPQPFGRE